MSKEMPVNEPSVIVEDPELQKAMQTETDKAQVKADRIKKQQTALANANALEIARVKQAELDRERENAVRKVYEGKGMVYLKKDDK